MVRSPHVRCVAPVAKSRGDLPERRAARPGVVSAGLVSGQRVRRSRRKDRCIRQGTLAGGSVRSRSTTRSPVGRRVCTDVGPPFL
jgi:hypothetical protein